MHNMLGRLDKLDKLDRRLIAAAAVAFALTLSAPTSAGVCLAQDLDENGTVDGADLGLLLAAWGEQGGFGPADFDSSGAVDGADLGLLLANHTLGAEATCLAITGISPATAAPGQTVHIQGTFPDTNYLDYCAVAITRDGTVIPFDVTNRTSTQLTATVGPVPPGTPVGTVMVGLGGGTLGIPGWPPGLRGQFNNVWTWLASGPGLTSNVEFTPNVPPQVQIAGTFYGSIVNGQLQLTLSGDCANNTSFAIWVRAHHNGNGTSGDPYVGYDCYIPSVSIQGSTPELACASQICGAVQTAFVNHLPNPIFVNCNTSSVSGGTKLTLSISAGSIDWGMFVVEAFGP